MHFLLDAALFLVLILALAGCALAAVRPGQGVLEGLVVHLLGLLGASAFVLWLTNSVFHLNFAFWPLLLPPLLLVLLHRHAGVSSPLSRIRRGFQTFERVDWALLLYVFGVSVLTFVLTLAPPNGADYDSLVYHLAAPQQYLRAGAVVELPYDHHSYFPFTMEMLFAFGLAARGAVFAKLFHWLMLPLACMALLAIGQRHLTRRAGLFAAALLASLPVVQIEASTAYIDLGLAAFSLGAVLCFCSWRETRSTRELLWCGAFCGFCLGTKYLGALTFGWIGIWVLVLAWSRRKSAGDITPVFGCAAIALVLGGGWYVRNFLWTGNPVFPFAYEVFGGKGWTAEMAKAYTRDQVEYGFGRGVLDWILLPWRLSMSPFNLTGWLGLWPFSGVTPGGGNGRFETPGMISQSIVGPALLAFGAPLLFMKRKPRAVGFALWSFLFFWLFWAATGQYLRYLVPAFAILCLACGWGIERYLQRGAILRCTVGFSLVAYFAVTPLLTILNAGGSLAVIGGGESVEAYLTRTFRGYDAMQWASKSTPENARFAVYGEPRCFYLRRDYFWADDAHNNLIDYEEANTPAKLIAALKALGATHVLWNSEPERNGGFGGAPAALPGAIEQGLLSWRYEEGGYRVYQIAEAKDGQ